MGLLKKCFLTALVVCSAGMAQAGILELRGGVGLNATNPKALEDRANAVSGGGIKANAFSNYNADLFVNLPALPIGFGLRQEWLNHKDGGNSGSNLDLKAQNLSLLVDWRIIDTTFYIGPIVGIGHPSAKIDYKSGAVSVNDHLKAKDLSYSAGLETGVILGGFIIGAEAGYQSLRFKSADSTNLKASVDLSGFYGKAMVGVTFF